MTILIDHNIVIQGCQNTHIYDDGEMRGSFSCGILPFWLLFFLLFLSAEVYIFWLIVRVTCL